MRRSSQKQWLYNICKEWLHCYLFSTFCKVMTSWLEKSYSLCVLDILEAHQGASRRGERATLSSSRLQQGFHDRPLPAAARQAHPHRWGQHTLPEIWITSQFAPLWLSRTPTVSLTLLLYFLCMFPEERNYICDQCGQTFKQRKHLSVHQMRHSGAKPLQ